MRVLLWVYGIPKTNRLVVYVATSVICARYPGQSWSGVFVVHHDAFHEQARKMRDWASLSLSRGHGEYYMALWWVVVTDLEALHDCCYGEYCGWS